MNKLSPDGIDSLSFHNFLVLWSTAEEWMKMEAKRPHL